MAPAGMRATAKSSAAPAAGILVCEGRDMHQGVGDSFLYLLDPGQDPSKREDNTLDIFFGLDDSLESCTQLPDGTVQSGRIESVSFFPPARRILCGLP
jgi:hypothetical protein